MFECSKKKCKKYKKKMQVFNIMTKLAVIFFFLKNKTTKWLVGAFQRYFFFFKTVQFLNKLNTWLSLECPCKIVYYSMLASYIFYITTDTYILLRNIVREFQPNVFLMCFF